MRDGWNGSWSEWLQYDSIVGNTAGCCECGKLAFKLSLANLVLKRLSLVVKCMVSLVVENTVSLVARGIII